MIRRPPRSTRNDTLFPYTTLFLSDGVRVVFLLQRRIYAAPFGKGPETAAADADFLAVALAELARQAEQVDRLLQGDGVHALAGAQRGAARIIFLPLGGAAECVVRLSPPQRPATRVARLRVGLTLSRAG